MKTQADLYRELPSVDELLHHPGIAALAAQEGQAAVADACRVVLDRLRDEISAGQLNGGKLTFALSGIQSAIGNEMRRALRYSLRPVINATGVILHTNLGRAPISELALQHICETAGEYSNLEFDLESGERGKRDAHVDRLFRKLLSEDGAELRSAGRVRAPVPTQASSISTIVVNNNAAAVLLALNTLAEGGEVMVSRGELVEIGGSFRIPDVMGKSGAVLREVGTTNRTRIADYSHRQGAAVGKLRRAAAEDVVVDVLNGKAAGIRNRRVPHHIPKRVGAGGVIVRVVFRTGDDEHLAGMEKCRRNRVHGHSEGERAPRTDFVRHVVQALCVRRRYDGGRRKSESDDQRRCLDH
jgi:hypothetical protein